jgi:hypothetical protein
VKRTQKKRQAAFNNFLPVWFKCMHPLINKPKRGMFKQPNQPGYFSAQPQTKKASVLKAFFVCGYSYRLLIL